MDRSSTNIPQRQNLGIGREQITAMLAVLNKRWLSQGWRVMDPKDAEPMALAYIELLNEHKIPYEQYQTLYARAVGLRAARISEGKSCDDFSADLMIACWPALRTELNNAKTIGADKQLYGEAYTPECDWCLDLGKILTGPRAGQPCPHRD